MKHLTQKQVSSDPGLHLSKGTLSNGKMLVLSLPEIPGITYHLFYFKSRNGTTSLAIEEQAICGTNRMYCFQVSKPTQTLPLNNGVVIELQRRKLFGPFFSSQTEVTLRKDPFYAEPPLLDVPVTPKSQAPAHLLSRSTARHLVDPLARTIDSSSNSIDKTMEIQVSD